MSDALARRQFLIKAAMASTSLLLPVKAVFADDEFERYKAEMNAGALGIQDEFARYKSEYEAAFSDYQREVDKFWATPEFSDKTLWVDYNKDQTIKRVVDFRKEEIRISVQGSALNDFSPQQAEQELRKALGIDISKAYSIDPVLPSVTGKRSPDASQSLLGLNPNIAGALNDSVRLTRKPGKQGDVLTLVAKLPKNSLGKRAEAYLPLVKSSAQKWQVPASLVMAVMHTESSFNPMARSHIPAFGLMQIVPRSAGRDASKLVFGQERLLTGQELYQPATNIEMGAAYLHILDKRYLAGIKDDSSRLYCVIAAYNTGAGNVAKAFSGTTSVKKSLPLINRLSAKQVYAHLRSNLRHEEARNYVKKVSQTLKQYRAV